MQKLTTNQKEQIAQALKVYCARYPSQNKAAQSLKGTSAGTVSSMLNGKWDLIGDDMWMKVFSQIERGGGWKLHRTAAYDFLTLYLQDAKEESNVVWITGAAGIGKSTTANEFAKANRNVFLLTCSEDMHKADFVHELAQKIGVRANGLTVRETLSAIIKEIIKLDCPLLIFDEGDKLTDTVLYYYISLYNALEEKCGMVFLSTNYICERIHKGVLRGKKGYDEIESRICRRFVPLDPVSSEEVQAICELNGLSDKSAIKSVVKEADECGNDLRRVKKCVHKELRKLERMAVQGNI